MSKKTLANQNQQQEQAQDQTTGQAQVTPEQEVLPIHLDVHPRRTDAAAIHPLPLQLCSDIQRSRRLLQQIDRHARIDQRPEEHIPADAGKALQVSDMHSS